MSVANTTICLKCKAETKDLNYGSLQVKTTFDAENRQRSYVFCTYCYDLTNKVDKLQLMLEDYFLEPAYAFLRPSVPPPAIPSFDCNPKTGPSPPDTSPNTTVEQWSARVLRHIEERDVAIQDLKKTRKSSEEWERTAKEYQIRGQELLNEARNWESKWFQLNEEYKVVYLREYKTLEEEKREVEQQLERKEWERKVLAEVVDELKGQIQESKKLLQEREEKWIKRVEDLNEENDSLEEEKRGLEEKVKGYQNCTVGGNRCFWKGENDKLKTKLEYTACLLNDALKKLGEKAKETSTTPPPPGWYPCPFSWNPERKRWERAPKEQLIDASEQFYHTYDYALKTFYMDKREKGQ